VELRLGSGIVKGPKKAVPSLRGSTTTGDLEGGGEKVSTSKRRKVGRLPERGGEISRGASSRELTDREGSNQAESCDRKGVGVIPRRTGGLGPRNRRN